MRNFVGQSLIFVHRAQTYLCAAPILLEAIVNIAKAISDFYSNFSTTCTRAGDTKNINFKNVFVALSLQTYFCSSRTDIIRSN